MRMYFLLALTCAFGLLIVAGVAIGESETEKTAREALEKAVEKGKLLFSDKKLGTSGRSCASCHANPKKEKLHLKERVGDYPKYDRGEKGVITLGTKILKMIEKNLKGKGETLGSDKVVAIEAYLMDVNRGD